MSWNWNSHGLPFLPGNTFRDVTKSAFHRAQTLSFKNGFAVPRRPAAGVGQDPLLSEELLQQQAEELYPTPAELTYGPSDHRCRHEAFTPAHVTLDKKTLRFYAYFVEDVQYSPEEQYRVRPVVAFYYLEDDSMRIIEPAVENAGIPQGTRVKRHRLPKNDHGEFYEWKDLNVAMDLKVYGVKYRITQCDEFTREFLESEGIIVNDPEEMPADPYLKRRENPQPSHATPSDHDIVYQFLTMDRKINSLVRTAFKIMSPHASPSPQDLFEQAANKQTDTLPELSSENTFLGEEEQETKKADEAKVLRFFALWDDADSLYGDTRPVTIQYYLVDDTVEIRDVHEPNSGRVPFPLVLRRQKLPKKIKQDPSTFPSCVLEVSPEDVQEFYSPKDFQLGQTVTLLGRRFLLYDCDGFTKEYYQKNHPDMQMKTMEVTKTKTDKAQESKKEVAPYNGFGSLDDSLQNCLSLIPKPPKKNVQKMLENDHKVLRYSARLDSQNPADEGRRFILSYYLSNDMISIFEKPTRNSGILGGKFLEKARVPKPGSTVENLEFYSPADLCIGSTVEVFSHRFVLTDADYYVLKYLESIAGQIPSQTLESLRLNLRVGAQAEQPADENVEIVPVGE